tara:strand:- start:2676 stop:3650 length:975 start_codon:yes stop_codon:yes gene_type:complete
MKSIKLEPIMEEKDADALIGSFLDESFIKYHITEDTEVFKENGDLLCILKKNAVPEKTLEMARGPFRKAISPTNNRGSAAGDVSKLYKVGDRIGSATIGEIKGNQYRALLKDGTLSKTMHAIPVDSSVIGYMDRYPRIPYCRTTAFSQKYFNEYNLCVPYIKCIDEVFKQYAPHRYKIQKSMAEASSEDFIIKDTAFTTVTVNKNFRTAAHKDKGDLKEGFGNLGVISRGKYNGFITVLPRYGVGLDINHGDVALFDVHEVHGNTEPEKISYFERISIVCYYREKMIYCGNKQYELDRAKTETKKVALPEEIEKADKIREKILS